MRARGVCAAGLLAAAMVAAPLRLEARARQDAEDQVGVFRTIQVSEGEAAGDIACAFCTVRIDGDVHGDVAVIFSTVEVGEGRTIGGDVATLFSTLRVGEGASIGGDLATALGTTSLAPGARVQGDRAMLSSGLGITMVLAPLLILAGTIWLLVWVARRLFA